MQVADDTGPVLEVDNLSRVFSVGRRELVAVDGVDFTLERQETLGIVGESGCGKSTIARLVLKLLPASGGRIRLNGEDVTDLGERAFRRRRQALQAVFQDPNSSLNPRLRVESILLEPLHRAALSRPDQITQVRDVLDAVGLPASALSRYPHEFSGGQRQRIAIARALVAKPDLIVCDEPTSALDVSVQAQVLNLLLDIQQSRRLSLLFISHNLAAVRLVSHRIAVMYLGRIVEIGGSSSIFSAPHHPYTEALLRAVPSPLPDQPRAAPVSGEVPSPFDRLPGCAFAARCPKVRAQCLDAPPPLLRSSADRAVRCFFPNT